MQTPSLAILNPRVLRLRRRKILTGFPEYGFAYFQSSIALLGSISAPVSRLPRGTSAAMRLALLLLPLAWATDDHINKFLSRMGNDTLPPDSHVSTPALAEAWLQRGLTARDANAFEGAVRAQWRAAFHAVPRAVLAPPRERAAPVGGLRFELRVRQRSAPRVFSRPLLPRRRGRGQGPAGLGRHRRAAGVFRRCGAG